MEELQRAKAEIVAVDEVIMEKVLQLAYETETHLVDGYSNTSTYAIFATENNVIDVLDENKDYIENLNKHIDDILDEAKKDAANMANFNFQSNEDARSFLEDMVPEITEDGPNFMYPIVNCSETSVETCVRAQVKEYYQDDFNFREAPESFEDAAETMTGMMVDFTTIVDFMGVDTTFKTEDMGNCSLELAYWTDTGNQSMTEFATLSGWLIEELELYEEAMRDSNMQQDNGGGGSDGPGDSPGGSPSDPGEQVDPRETAHNDYDFTNLTALIVNISRLTTDDKFMPFYKKTITYNRMDGSGSGLNIGSEQCDGGTLEHMQYCQCYGMHLYKKVDRLKDDEEDEGEIAESHHNLMNARFIKVQETLEGMNTSYHEKIEPLVNLVTDYQEKVKTKKQLAFVYDDIMTTNKMDAFISYGTTLTSAMEQIVESIAGLQRMVPKIIENILDSNIPIITKDNYQNTKLGEMLQKFENESIYQEYFTAFNTDFNTQYRALIRKQYDNKIQTFKILLSKIVADSTFLIAAMDVLKTSLTTYGTTIEMNEAFYM